MRSTESGETIEIVPIAGVRIAERRRPSGLTMMKPSYGY